MSARRQGADRRGKAIEAVTGGGASTGTGVTGPPRSVPSTANCTLPDGAVVCPDGPASVSWKVKARAVMDTQGVTTVGSTGMVTSGYFCCAEQLELQSLIAGMDMSRLRAVSDLAGDGQAHTAFAVASRARIEIETAMQQMQV